MGKWGEDFLESARQVGDDLADSTVPLRHIPRMLTRDLIGDEKATMLGIEMSPVGWEAIKPLLMTNRVMAMLGEGGYQNVPIARMAAEWLYNCMGNGMQDLQRDGNLSPFSIPAQVAKDIHEATPAFNLVRW